MRADPSGSILLQRNREPRIVIGIIYPFGSIYVTNRANSIANVPGAVLHGALQDVSASSQELFPDEGRATIGQLTFSVVDLAGALTDEFREQLLTFDNGLGRREVRAFTGDTDDFNDGTWRRVETYVIDWSVEYDRGSYRFSCSDIQRELRQRIFTQATTRLTSDLAEDGTTLNVESTDGFEMLEHTASFSDAPSVTVGYVTVKKTGEVIRYTGKTDTSFTGCTRAVFSTRVQAVDVDETAEVDRRPEIEECVYLELPAPQLIYALITGSILDTAINLPDSWNLGILTSFVDADLFRQIGTDLYDPADFSAGFVLRFSSARGLKETDGKRFIEEQVHVPAGTFCPISAEGKLGLRRLVRTLADAAPSAVLNSDNIVDFGPLMHRVGDIVNRMIIRWNHDGESFTREDVLVNNNSIAEHGIGRTVELELLGLFVARHTRAVLARIRDWFTDRYGAPPQELELTLLPSMNNLEVGDAARVVLAGIRDYAGAGSLDRSFEIQSRQMNWQTGDLGVRAFGSTRETLPDQPLEEVDTTPLDDEWYSSEGVALSTVLTIVGNHVTVDGDIPGGSDLRTAVYYHPGDLTINAGMTVTINLNTQLRVLGTLTIDGDIDGRGRGIPATTDPNVVSSPFTGYAPAPTFVPTLGSTRGSAGVWYTSGGEHLTFESSSYVGVPAMARPAIDCHDGALEGIPAELRGTPGIWGMSVIEGSSFTVRALGGAGGASGAGLMIVCRGLAFGVSGAMDLSGADGSAAAPPVTVGGHSIYGGGGGGGAPGCLLVLLDGSTVSLPDLSGAFSADHGATIQTGNPIHRAPPDGPADPWTGKDPGLGSFDLFESARLVMWVPSDVELGDSADEGTPAPQSFAVVGSDVGLTASWSSPAPWKHDFVQVFEAISNDRSGALLVFQGLADSFFKTSAETVTRYFWMRAGRVGIGYSDWVPASPTGGLEARYGGPAGLSQWTPVTFGVTRVGQTFTKTSGGTGWNAGFYSFESFDSCVITFRPDQTTSYVMVGLNSDPAAGHDYASIDHAIYCPNDGILQIYESGVQIVANAGAYSTADQLTISYDGQRVRYYRNSELLWSTPRVGARLYADSSFLDEGASVSGVAIGPIGVQLAVLEELRDDFAYKTDTDFHRYWINRNGGGELAFVTGSTDVAGGTALQVGNSAGNDQRWMARLQLTPYDGVSLYEIGVIAKRAGGAGNKFYCGLEGVAADGVTLINTSGANGYGSQHYLAASDVDLPSTWTTYRGFVRGFSATPTTENCHDSSTPGQMFTGAVYVRPLLIANYLDATGQIDIAAVWVRRLGGALGGKNSVDTPQIDVDATQESASVQNAGPIVNSESGALASHSLQIEWVTFTINEDTDVVHIFSSFRHSVSGSGGVGSAAFVRNPSTGTIIQCGQPIISAPGYAGLGVCIGHVTNILAITGEPPGTAFAFGFFSAVTNTGASISATYEDITVVATKGKR